LGLEDRQKTSHLLLTQIAGKNLFLQKKCNDCHVLTDEAQGKQTPVLNKRNDSWFEEHVKTESEIVIDEASSDRKKRKLLAKEIEALSDFLFKSKDDRAEIIGLPEDVTIGAYYAYQNSCLGCHMVAGQGKERAPELTFVADKKTNKQWHIENLKNPQQFAPDSPMPAFEGKLSDKIIGQMAEYLLSLKK
jgi:mono/diheme cytochrome c family protein